MGGEQSIGGHQTEWSLIESMPRHFHFQQFVSTQGNEALLVCCTKGMNPASIWHDRLGIILPIVLLKSHVGKTKVTLLFSRYTFCFSCCSLMELE